MGNFFTIALFFTILITPSANVTVTTMGRPSGMAATARLQTEKKTGIKIIFHLIPAVFFLRLDGIIYKQLMLHIQNHKIIQITQ